MSLDVYLDEGDGEDGERLYQANITHNLNRMAKEGGFYEVLWRPDELGIKTARELIAPLTDAFALLLKEPERFKAHNPANGWGDYEGLVRFVAGYAIACSQHPDARVSVWR